MEKLTTEEIKRTELDILLWVNELCGQNNLRYSLCGGSLIGAVRHEGFIPWDDDVDICMPRPDYEKLLEIYRRNPEQKYALAYYGNTKGYYNGTAKIYDPSTILFDPNGVFENLGIGVHIDIFPVDGLGKDYKEAKTRYNSTRWKRELLIARRWRVYSRSITRAWYYEPIRFGLFVVSRFVDGEKLLRSIERDSAKTDFDQSSYAACIYGRYRSKEILPREYYDTYVRKTFEGHLLSCSRDYDSFLRAIYGDYMELPPENKRISQHEYEAYKK